MTDLERDLRQRLRTVSLPPAPATLERSLRDIVAEPVVARRSPRPLILLGLAAVLLVGGAIAVGAPLLNRDVTISYTDTFSPTGSMTTPRDGQMAALLPDGRVLIAGGWDGTPGGGLSSAELYDAATGTFSPTGSMRTPRSRAAAISLPDGRVLIAGGMDRPAGDTQRATTAELYDPRTGTFMATGSMTTARDGATATLLTDGRVLFAGGSGGLPGTPLSSAELYDPRTGTFSATGSMTMARDVATAVLLDDGRVLIVGGRVVTGDSVAETASAELYDPRTGTFSATGSMSVARVQPAGVLLPDGRVLIVGGWLSPVIAGDQPVGGAFNGLASAELYDPRTGTFTETGSTVSAHRSQVATLLRDGRVLVTGVSDLPVLPEVYDPATGTFSQTAAPSVSRGDGTMTLLRDGRVLVAGGYSPTTVPAEVLASAELFH